MPNNKKIGLLTMPLDTNYGGILQLVALQDFLRSEGYETVLIDRRYPSSRLKLLLKWLLEHQGLIDYKDIVFRKKMSRQVHAFIDKYVHSKTRPIYEDNTLRQVMANEGFMAVIVGSDQVWRIDYMYGIWRNAFLNFVGESSLKISYAASFGKGDWQFPDLTTTVSKLLNRFDAISVREDSGVAICQDVFGLAEVTHVVDPTLLMPTSYYNSFLRGQPSVSDGLFTYILDDENYHHHLMETLQEKLQLQCYSINVGKPISAYKKERNYEKPPVEEWLQSFASASFVVTDSFHGTIFSIIYNKPFITVANTKRGITRFESLLGRLGLQDRLIAQGEDIDVIAALKPIDYNKVNTTLATWRERSKDFLKQAISKG